MHNFNYCEFSASAPAPTRWVDRDEQSHWRIQKFWKRGWGAEDNVSASS